MAAFVLANRTTLIREGKVFETARAAKTSLAAIVRKGNRYGVEVMTIEEFRNLDAEVEVINLMSGKPCKIRKSQVGGACDPSTETYWSM